MRLRAAGAIGEQSWGRKFGHFLLKVEPWLLGGFSPGGPTGGIIIPDTAKEKPQQGEVVATGPGARNERGQLVQLDVKPGDLVLFGKWSGTEVKLAGEEFLIMKESDLLGVIDKADIDKKAA